MGRATLRCPREKGVDLRPRSRPQPLSLRPSLIVACSLCREGLRLQMRAENCSHASSSFGRYWRWRAALTAMLGQAAANRPLVRMTIGMAFSIPRLFRIVSGSLLWSQMD